ncbi:MAG: HlyD family secretion protein, partial [Phycisphaerae bacterium]
MTLGSARTTSIMEKLRKIINAALAVVVLSTALLVMAWMISTRPVPLRTSEGVRVPEVLTSQATPTVFDAPVVAYGTIQPKNQVKIIPQVSGMLVYAHPDLAPGKIIPAGETLFEIDPRAYESQVKQVEADIALLKVQRTQHQVQADHLSKRLEIANEQFELARKDLEREQGLLESGVSKAIEVDVARQKFLKFQDMVMGYQSQLAMIPHRIAETQARLDARQAQLADARRNLDSTKIVCPFNARVGTVLAKASQV